MIWNFAISQLESGVGGRSVVSLFTRNYQRGDEQRILSSLTLPDDDFERHSLLMNVIKVLTHNPTADVTRLAMIVYSATPCALCREDSVELLLRQHAAPEWLIEECRFDAYSACRELVSDSAAH